MLQSNLNKICNRQTEILLTIQCKLFVNFRNNADLQFIEYIAFDTMLPFWFVKSVIENYSYRVENKSFAVF